MKEQSGKVNSTLIACGRPGSDIDVRKSSESKGLY